MKRAGPALRKQFDTATLSKNPRAGQPKVAYFSMEYGLHISLRLYSGGLGVYWQVIT